MSNQTRITVGSKITTRQEYPAYIVEGVKVFGYLPAGAVGEVIGHTADGRAMISFDGEIHTFESLDNLTVELANRRWTDAGIDYGLICDFALTRGWDLDKIENDPTFHAVYRRMIGLRDDLTAQLAAARQRIAELEQTKPVQWTDELIQAMTIFIEHGDNLEWLRNESAEVVMLANVLQMRNDLTAQIAAAHQRIAELERGAAEWKPASGYFEDAQGDSMKLYIDDGFLSLFASGESMTFALPDELRLVQREGSRG